MVVKVRRNRKNCKYSTWRNWRTPFDLLICECKKKSTGTGTCYGVNCGFYKQ